MSFVFQGLFYLSIKLYLKLVIQNISQEPNPTFTEISGSAYLQRYP